MTETPKIRVLVADDHQVVRVGLRSIIDAEPDMEVVAEASDGRGAIAAFAEHQPDITLLDLRMPGLSGAHVITEIRKLSPKAHVIVVTSYDADEDVYRAMQAGARCYLLKDTFTEGMLDAIRMVHAGRRLIDPALAARLVDRVNEPGADHPRGGGAGPGGPGQDQSSDCRGRCRWGRRRSRPG